MTPLAINHPTLSSAERRVGHELRRLVVTALRFPHTAFKTRTDDSKLLLFCLYVWQKKL